MTRLPQPLRLLQIPVLPLLIAAMFMFTACSPPGDSGSIGSDVTLPAPAGAASENGGAAGGASGSFGELPTDTYSNSSTRAVVMSTGLDIHNAPDGSVVETLDATTEYGSTRVLLVEETQGDWVRVRLPMRPNHRSGWVPAADVLIDEVDPSIHIDLEQRTMTVSADGGVVFQSTVAVGSQENPTPIGTFFITDKLETPEPGGTYGPFAFGLSGYSDTLTEFAGGDGQIGIHGTNDPTSLGEAVSHGCIRLPNELVTTLADLLPLGTPVHIV